MELTFKILLLYLRVRREICKKSWSFKINVEKNIFFNQAPLKLKDTDTILILYFFCNLIRNITVILSRLENSDLPQYYRRKFSGKYFNFSITIFHLFCA